MAAVAVCRRRAKASSELRATHSRCLLQGGAIGRRVRPMISLVFSLLFVFWQQQQLPSPPAFTQVNPLSDSPAVRDEWRRAYKDFKPPAAVSRRNKSLDARRNSDYLKYVVC